MNEYDPFAEIYDDWSAHMTEDVAFYVDLAREAEGPSSSSRSATAALRSRSRGRPA